MYNETFIELLVDGRALADDADDFVDQWSDSQDRRPLHEFLGMSWDEYSLWVEQPAFLRYIVVARLRGKSTRNVERGEVHAISEYSSPRELAAVARASDSKDAQGVLDWLKRTGRIEQS
jgi:hypothetical protein